MGGGRVMASFWEALGIDKEAIKQTDVKETNEFKELERTIKLGSGIQPESLKLYNKHMNSISAESITARKYYSDQYIYTPDIDALLYGINCIQEFCQSIFEIEIEAKDAATIDYSEFQKYYEEGSDQLNLVKELYPVIISAVKTAHTFTNTKLANAGIVLEALDLEIPKELTLVMYIQKNYAKNQYKKATKELVIELLPQINNQIILEQIATKALA